MTRRSSKRRRAAARQERGETFSADHIHSLVDRAVVVLVCVKVAVVILAFDRTTDMPFVVPKVLASHALSWVLVSLMAMKVILGGFRALRWSLLHHLVLAFLGASVLSAAFGVDRELALYGTHNRMLGLGTTLDGAVTFFAAAAVVSTYRRGVALLATGLATTTIVLGYEVIQLLGRDPFVWDIVGTISPFSTLGQPTTLAYFLATVAAICLAIAALVPAGRSTRAGLAAFTVVAVFGAVATGSRLTVVGVVVAGALLWLMLLIQHQRVRTRVTIGALGVAAAFGMAVVVAVSPLGARFAASLETAVTTDGADDVLDHFDPSTAGRLTLYGMAFEMMRDRPLLGVGPDSFAAAMPAYRPAGAPPELRRSIVSSAHGWIAQLGSTTGVLGLVSFLLLAGAAFWLAVRRGPPPVARALAVAFVAHLGAGVVTVNEVTTDLVTWILLGGIAAATWLPGMESARGPRLRLTMGTTAALAAALLIGAVGVATVLPALDASRIARLSQDARLSRQVPQAIAAALRATSLDPERAEYWRKLALAYAAAARWNDSAAAFEHASRLAPYDVHNIGDLIGAKASNNDDAARAGLPELAEKMVQIDQNNPYAHLTKAAVMQLASRQDDAVAAIQRALELDPGSNNVGMYALAAQLFLSASRSDDAERVAREGITIVDPTEISQRSVPLRYERARALASLGRKSDAIAELNIVLALQPSHTAAAQLRALLR